MKGSLFRGFLSLVLLSFVSCGGTEFSAKDIGIEEISENPDGGSFGWEDPEEVVGGHFNDPTKEVVTDSFIYDEDKENAPVDILFVVDDSGSMGDNQDALATNFGAFITDFVTKGLDFNMAITTTDMSAGKAGVPVAGSMSELTYQNYLADSNQFFTDFSDMIRVGTTGSGIEKGLGAAKAFFDGYEAAFVRPDSYLTVIYVSDEEDQSDDSLQSYLEHLRSLKADPSRVQAHAIVHENNGAYTGARYMGMAIGMGGTHEDIGNNFAQTLGNISTSIITKIMNYNLSATPDVSSIKVVVEGQLLNGSEWTYNASLNSIEFVNGLDLGAEIKVYYYKL